MTFGTRLRELRKKNELTLQQVADHFGITRGAVAAWEADQTRPDQDRLYTLARVLNTSVDYLLTGQRRHDNNVSAGPNVRGHVPLISWVQAGNWTEIVDNFAPGEAEEWLPCPASHGAHTFAVRVEGLSMYNPGGEKSYNHGDIIFVDPERPYHNGSMVVVRLEDAVEATFKQLIIDERGKMYLRALNPSWPQPIIEIDQRATICGVVFGRWIPE